MQNKIPLCKIVRPHGIKGGVKVLSLQKADMPFFALNNVYIGADYTLYMVEKVLPLNNAYVLYFKDYEKIEQIESLKNKIVYIEKTDYKEFFLDNFLLQDLVGLQVVTKQNELLGYVVKTDDSGYQDVITINCDAVCYDIPFVQQVAVFDKKQNKIIIDRQTFLEVRV